MWPKRLAHVAETSRPKCPWAETSDIPVTYIILVQYNCLACMDFKITTLPSQNPLGRLKKCKLADVDSDSPLFVDALGDQGMWGTQGGAGGARRSRSEVTYFTAIGGRSVGVGQKLYKVATETGEKPVPLAETNISYKSVDSEREDPDPNHGKGTGGGKARRKLVLGEPQPCPEETDLDDTLELEELLQLLKDGEDQPPARPSTPTDQRDTNTFGKGGSVETLRRAQNVVNAEASTSFTPGIVGGEEPPSRQNTNDSGSDLFTGGFHTSLGENSTEVRLPLHDNVFITAVQAVRGGAGLRVLVSNLYKVAAETGEKPVPLAETKLRRSRSVANKNRARSAMAHQEKTQQQKRKSSLVKTVPKNSQDSVRLVM
ncbi:hypothetical protein Bbelb_221610 [Branchiostoma belcheri]|nr:hypothetical protein Bbelb_221610 [Branchiostoma belcheri]